MPSTKPHPLIVALDIGTSSTRALLYDSAGRMQPGCEVQVKYQQTYTPDGGVECDAEQLFHNTVEAIKRLLGTCTSDQIGRIGAVAASCFWHGLMGIDGHGKPVTPIFSWADTRAGVEIPRLSTALDPHDYHKRTGCFLHSSYWPAKIAWLREAQPHIADRVQRWVSFSDYLALRLFGKAVTSLSTASGTGLINESTGGWDEKTLRAISLSEDSLSVIADETVTLQLVDKALLPQLADVPWFPAFGDGACSNIGAGGVNDTRVVINVSTSGAIRVLCPQPSLDVPRGLFRYRMDKNRWVIGGAVSNGGNVYAWLSRTMQLPDEKALDRKLISLVPDSHGVTVLPFWAGERSPGWHPVARASITGLNLSTSPIEIAQASLESVAYTFRTLREDILKAFPMATQTIVSGGAVEHSKYLPHLLANVLNCPVRESLDPEPSGRGAALAVAERMGSLKSIESAQDKLSKPIEPSLQAVEIYDKGYARFQTLYSELIGKPVTSSPAAIEQKLNIP